VAVRGPALLGGRKLIRPLRLAWLFFRIGSLNELQYRVNFFIQLLQSAVSVGTALAVLALVYSHTDKLNGWTESELLVVMGIQILLGGVIRMSIQPNMERLMEEVRDGKLDFALTKPEDSQVLISVRDVRIWRSVDIVAGALVLAYGVAGLDRAVGAADALLFLAMLGVGALMIYCFWLVISTGAFWIVNMWSIIELFDGVYQTGRWPVSIYPGWLRIGVTFLVPIAFAVTVPAEAVTSRLEWPTVVLAIGFAAALFVLTRWFWRFGLRRYSGASA
jgi:viologen exporter family transport system permease protein